MMDHRQELVKSDRPCYHTLTLGLYIPTFETEWCATCTFAPESHSPGWLAILGKENVTWFSLRLVCWTAVHYSSLFQSFTLLCLGVLSLIWQTHALKLTKVQLACVYGFCIPDRNSLSSLFEMVSITVAHYCCEICHSWFS